MSGARFLAIGLAAVALSFGGCEPSPTASNSAEPKRLRIAFVPQQDQEERYAAAYRALDEYLEPLLGIPVEIVQLESATIALEGLRAGRLDLCNFSPWPYLIAEQKAGMEAILVTGSPDGAPVCYRTVLIARPALALRNVDDIKARSRELIFSFEEAISTSGHLVPRAFLHSVGMNPEKDFKQTIFSADSTVSILALRSGRLDVAAVSDTGLARAIRMKRVVADDVSVVWTSEPVLANLLAIRRALPAAFKDRVRDALLQLPKSAPQLWSEVTRQYSQPVAAYLPANDSLLAPYREWIRTVPGLQIAL